MNKKVTISITLTKAEVLQILSDHLNLSDHNEYVWAFDDNGDSVDFDTIEITTEEIYSYA